MSRNDDKLLRVNVAARRLGVSDRHVRRLVCQGKLEAERRGERLTLVPESAVEAYRHREE
jgi:excisionase family DNA binding protein